MTWQKIRRIFNPVDALRGSGYSHSSNPFAILDESSGYWKIYNSPRTSDQQAVISYFIVDPKIDFKLIDICSEPIITPGNPGYFDDRGCSLGCIVKHINICRIYYLGWNLGKDVPFRNAIGIAEKDSLGRYRKIFKGPILDRSIHDPFSISYPFVLVQDGKWKMWYGSHKEWGVTTDDMVHVLKYAESHDGISWEISNHICIDSTDEDYAFSRPYVIYEDGIHKMWYSYRGGKYRIGYAESLDGLSWVRRDNFGGLGTSDSGWDSEMVCYPNIVEFGGERYLLYNGNGYGSTGIGVAIWKI